MANHHLGGRLPKWNPDNDQFLLDAVVETIKKDKVIGDCIREVAEHFGVTFNTVDYRWRRTVLPNNKGFIEGLKIKYNFKSNKGGYVYKEITAETNAINQIESVYFQDNTNKVYVALDDLNFNWKWDYKDVMKFDDLYRKLTYYGKNTIFAIQEIARLLNRDMDEVMVLAIDRARQGKIGVSLSNG